MESRRKTRFRFVEIREAVGEALSKRDSQRDPELSGIWNLANQGVAALHDPDNPDPNPLTRENASPKQNQQKDNDES